MVGTEYQIYTPGDDIDWEAVEHAEGEHLRSKFDHIQELGRTGALAAKQAEQPRVPIIHEGDLLDCYGVEIEY